MIISSVQRGGLFPCCVIEQNVSVEHPLFHSSANFSKEASMGYRHVSHSPNGYGTPGLCQGLCRHEGHSDKTDAAPDLMKAALISWACTLPGEIVWFHGGVFI